MTAAAPPASKISSAVDSAVAADKPAPAPVQSENGSLRSNLRASVIDGAAYGSMVGLGETYLAAFVLAMGLGEVTSGLVTTVPMVVGGIMQLVSPHAIRRIGSYKTWVVSCAIVQALSFLPLIVAACWGRLHVATALIAASIYWGSGMATGAAWNVWIGSLVPKRIRSRFFAQRTRTSQLLVFIGFLMGGLLLQSTSDSSWLPLAFGVLFSCAVISRIASAVCLYRQSETPGLASSLARVPFRELIDRMRNGGGRLVIYLVAVQAAVQISGPYFSPFLLKQMNVSYGSFVLLLSLVYLSKIIAFPVWGRVGKSIGAYRLLWIGGIGIVPASGLWILSQDIFFIATLQILAGIFWAAYELGFFLLFFESFPERERAAVLTFYNFLNTVAWVTGAVVGGLLLLAMNTSTFAYFWVFAISSCGRAAALLLLARVPFTAVPTGPLGIRTLNVRLGAASSDVPVLPSFPADREKVAA